MDRVGAFIDEVDGRLRRDDDRDPNALESRRYRLKTVIDRCGWKHRSTSRMENLSARLQERGLHSDPPLTDDGHDRNTWIRFSREPPPVPVHRVPSERELIRYIEANHRLIPPLDQYGSDIVAEFRLPSGRRVDLLIRDKKRTRWLLIEVENKQRMNQESPAQLRDYMVEVAEKCLPHDYVVEGMVISAAADPHHVELLMAPGAPGRTHWLTFSMQLKLKPAPSTVPIEAE